MDAIFSAFSEVDNRNLRIIIAWLTYGDEKLFKITTFFVNSFITNLQSFQFVLFPLFPTMKKYIPALFL